MTSGRGREQVPEAYGLVQRVVRSSVDRGRLQLPSSGEYASSAATSITMEKDQVSWQVPYAQAHSAVVASAPSNTGFSEVETRQNFSFPLSSLVLPMVEEENRDQRPMDWF